MLPQPPALRQSVSRYEPQELFYIVKHGIKLTGMPAWPALRREDEVWAMVAFLRRLPALDATTYQQITGTAGGANGPMPIERLDVTGKPPDVLEESCRRCHGVDGLGRGGAFPRLAGQRPEYLLASLRAYARGERQSGIMQPVASSLQRDAMVRMAAYYAAQPIPPTAGAEAGTTASASGQRIAHAGIPSQLVPACVKCHGPGSHPRNPHYPVLAGQYAEYLVQQLSLFKAGDRGGTPYEHIMRKVARQLTADQIEAVAEYYASLPAEPAGR
jgi:cytochrome c553